jgi:hypothetical protein
MKNRYAACATLVVLLSFVFIAPTTKAVVGAIAECTDHLNGSGNITLAAYQTFVPNVNRLTGAGFYVDYVPPTGPPAQTPLIGIRDNAGTTLVQYTITDINDGWHSFNFPSELTVTPGATYRIFYENGGTDWSLAYSSSESCYGSGQAYYDGVPVDWNGGAGADWTFSISGYNYVAPTPTPASTPTPTPTTTATPTPTVNNDASVSSDSDATLGASLDDANGILLAASNAESASKKPMPTLTKILIGVGAFLVLLLALLAYLVFIKKNKSLRKLLHLKKKSNRR